MLRDEDNNEVDVPASGIVTLRPNARYFWTSMALFTLCSSPAAHHSSSTSGPLPRPVMCVHRSECAAQCPGAPDQRQGPPVLPPHQARCAPVLPHQFSHTELWHTGITTAPFIRTWNELMGDHDRTERTHRPSPKCELIRRWFEGYITCFFWLSWLAHSLRGYPRC